MTAYRDSVTPSEIVDLYLGTVRARPNTMKVRAVAVKQFVTWCEETDTTFAEITPVMVLRFLQSQRDKGNAESTLNSKLHTLKHFFGWLVERGLIVSAPTDELPTSSIPPKPRETLTLAELRKIWEAAPTETHRVVVGLLGFAGMRPDEVSSLDVTDFRVANDYHRVTVRSRPPTRGHIEVLVPPEVGTTIQNALGDRRVGPLLIRTDGRRLDRHSLQRMVRISAKYAGIPFKVNSLTLTYTLRALAIEHGFTYLGVVRAVGEIHPTKAGRWFVDAPNAPEQHAAIRLGRLVFTEANTPQGMLAEADVCLTQSSLPDAIAVMTAGAALEKHLRELARENSISFRRPEKDLQIGHYKTELTRVQVLSRHANLRIGIVEKHRNDAAHGWFELVTRDIARDVIDACRDLIAEFPLKGT